jgi:hypothetical protein
MKLSTTCCCVASDAGNASDSMTKEQAETSLPAGCEQTLLSLMKCLELETLNTRCNPVHDKTAPPCHFLIQQHLQSYAAPSDRLKLGCLPMVSNCPLTTSTQLSTA